MIKILKFTILIFYSSLFFSCGFSPMYKNIETLDISITSEATSGNREINNIIKSNLKVYDVDNATKKYEVLFNSEYEKITIAKNTTGAATEYKLVVKANFLINSKEYKYKETFNMKSMTDKIEEQDYEKNIKKSLTNIITRKLITQISQLNDN